MSPLNSQAPNAKPIAVFQHTRYGGPGAVTSILEHLGRKVEVIRIFDGEDVPSAPEEFSGLVFLGGGMSVHDPLPWIHRELELIRAADVRDIPMVGHCLGSQLIAVALGGTVRKHSHPELGWGEIQAESDENARCWWGSMAGGAIETFQWHQDTFEPPPGAELLASGRYCRNQVFAMRGRHLLIQSHLEFTHSLIERTIEKCSEQLNTQISLGNPAVQAPEKMLRDVDNRTSRMHEILAGLYLRWLINAM